VIQTEKLYRTIVEMYPSLAEQDITFDLQYSDEYKAWAIDLRQANHHLKSYISTTEAEGLISGQPCESLAMQFDMLAHAID